MHINKQLKQFVALIGVVIIALALGNGVASAATYHVRAGATGTANGADWINAYPMLPTTLSRGSTYYVATGTYGGYTFNTTESGTNVVTVKKATVLDHGSNTGWNDSYGIGAAVFTNYWRIKWVEDPEAGPTVMDSKSNRFRPRLFNRASGFPMVARMLP
jgi:hypothetical protein